MEKERLFIPLDDGIALIALRMLAKALSPFLWNKNIEIEKPVNSRQKSFYLVASVYAFSLQISSQKETRSIPVK